MIDPITALAGIQSAVALIKKVSKTVDDVSSLGPVLGKYFDAKSTATKAVAQAKISGKKSSMAAAIEIEMALEQTKQFEKELQFLFMQTGKIDVWNKIKARAAQMDKDTAHEERKQKLQRKKDQENLQLILVIVILVVSILGVGSWIFFEIVNHCNSIPRGCGG